MTAAIGRPVPRIDGLAKVTGAAKYAAEFSPIGLTHAALARSTVARGRITGLDVSEAEQAPGVHAVISHLNAPKLPYREPAQRPVVDPQVGQPLRVFQGPEILFDGQPVAVVVAETREQARHAAALVRVAYEEEKALTAFAPERAREPSGAAADAGRRGDPEKALSEAEVTVQATYLHPREHHNAIEPHATIAAWDGDRLTLHDKTQWVDNDREAIANVFGIPAENVRVISPYVGGAFGSALRTWPHVAIAALAAREVRLPVSLALSRRELYSMIGFRPRTEQRVALGAGRNGRLAALVQEAVGQTSTYEEYAEATLSPPRMAYSCANVRTAYRLVEMNTNTPCPMRAPGEVTGTYALETAMDELAAALGLDPLELRLCNFAERDEDKDLPWSSNELRACYAEAAERFGWSARAPEPGSMRNGRERVGYGMATAVYPGNRMPAVASATVFANGSAVVRSASSDMGPGTYTSMTQVAAEMLGLPMERVRFELGDTELPKAPVHGGSMTMASVGAAVAEACRAVKRKAQDLDRHSEGVEADRSGSVDYAEVLRHGGLDRIDATAEAHPGEEAKTHSSYAFGAVFVEVRVDPELGTVRVPRMVGAYDIGRVVNPALARSQCLGGMVGGLGMALMEQAEWDERLGRVMNSNLAEYLVPVNADVGGLEVHFVPGDDHRFSPLGTKGVAELALCGVAPAISNAVFHATGQRIRELPITPDRLVTADRT